MILLLDTSTPICRLGVWQNEKLVWHEWHADRQLAKGLLTYIKEFLLVYDATFTTLDGIGVFRGPGSFTGLRIGMTVANTLADSIAIPIVGEHGESWAEAALARLARGDNDMILLPEYGAEAHITKPRK